MSLGGLDKGRLETLQWRLYRLVEAARDAMRALEDVLGADAYHTPVAEIFDLTPVAELELSSRADNCLNNEGLKTVGEVMAKSDGELLRIPNFGKKSLRELKQAIAAYKRKAAQKETASGNPQPHE